ncbi:MAG: hypothetical protein Q8M94_10865, partial [Ignavibacteria bacterium]|nr:hypothetical protein [Ignavibacteria bacterium]
MDEEKVKEETKKIIGKGRKALRYGVNIFVYTFVSLFMLLMIFFGISQTSFFKNWLRDTVVEIVNDEIHGKLSIGEIDGTIFTSLLIKNVTLTSLQNDTVISAGNIELRTSPLKILFKNIYVRKFELKDAKIKLVEESDGELNLLKIFPPSTEPEDTTTSEFPFTIEVADFALTNVDFSMQRYDKVGSNEYFQSINTDDLRINDLNVSFNAFADLNKYAYRLTINNISFSPNFNFFQLQHLSGSILLTPQLAGINKLHLITRDSDVELSAAISGVDFLEDFSIEKLETAPVRLSFSSTKLNVDDVTTYVPAMKMFDGIISTELEGSGTFNELLLKKFNINYNNTSLKAKGVLKNLLDADKMNFDIRVTDSYIDPSDPNKLLRDLELPEYIEFGVFKIDTLTYFGGPFDFKTTFAIRTDKGNLNGATNIDLRSTEMIYEANLITKNLDLGPFTSISTDINSEINISGVGSNPEKMKLNLSMNASSSKFGEKYLRDISLNTFAENGMIKTSLKLSSDSTNAEVLADFDFTNPNDPAYEIKGNMVGINLARLINNQSLDSDINLSFDASGQGFNPDSMDLFLVTDIQNSRFLDFNIDSTRLIMDIRRNENGKKIINVISEIADLTISGDYQITSLGDVLVREGDIIQAIMYEKINPVFFPDSVNSLTVQNVLSEQHTSVEDFSLEYLLDFKESMNINIGKDQLEIDGLMSGLMKSKNDSLVVTLIAQFDYFKYWDDENVFFLVNSKLNTNLSNNLVDGYGGNLSASLKFNSERIYAGGNIYNLSSEFSLENNELKVSLDGQYDENIKTALNASALFAGQSLDIKIDKFNLTYNDLNIYNKKDILLSCTNQAINFDNLNLQVADGTITASGSFGAIGNHNAVFSLDSLSGNKIVRDIMGSPGQKDFDADIKLQANLNGNFYNPKFSVVGSAKNIKYGSGNFGSLISSFDYSDNLLYTNIRFLDSLENPDKPALLVSGSIPLNLSADKDTLYKRDKSIDLTIQSDEYDLSSLKNMFPYLQFQKGTLESDIYLSGTLDKPVALGYFSINDAKFKVKNNNLNYDFNTKVWIDDEEITIESIELKNVFGTSNGGTVSGRGFVRLDRFRFDSTFISVNGDLKVLDQVSKNSSPLVFGDLALKTRGDIVFSGNKVKSYLTIPIDVTVADLVVPLSKSAYSSSSEFIYKYADYSSAPDRLQSELDSLIEMTNRNEQLDDEKIKASKFDYTVDIKLDTEAEVVVVLSKELDQNLVVVLDGDFLLESVDGKKKSGGQLNLLDGSTLSFIKSLEAEGNIKFDKIDNPIIDVSSTYKDYYYPPDLNSGQTEQEVAVKIKLKGPLSELNKNFIKDENNIGVYMGRQAIEEDKKDPSKNATDAMYFLIIGKFPGDDNSQQNKNLVASTSTALAGSLLGEVLNQYFDDYIKGFQLRQTGTETKFNLIGKAW